MGLGKNISFCIILIEIQILSAFKKGYWPTKASFRVQKLFSHYEKQPPDPDFTVLNFTEVNWRKEGRVRKSKKVSSDWKALCHAENNKCTW